MKVLFLIQGWEAVSSRYRVLQYIPYLESKGVEVTTCPFPKTLQENIRFIYTLPQYDLLFSQRKLIHGLMLMFLRKRARRIIYDFDDAVMFRSSGTANPHSPSREKRFIRMVQAVDFVIAGNEFLKEKVLPLTTNVVTIPTAIDRNRYGLKDYRSQNKKVTLGWIGGKSSIRYLEKIRPILERIGRRYPECELKIVCDVFFDCEKMKVIKKNWNSEEEVADLQSFDIGLMPLVDDPWSWGKCGLKIVQYQGVGLPVVCTPVGVNRDLVEDGVNGFWAMTPEDWEERLTELIENAGLREKMGKEGRRRALEKFTVQACAPRLLSILQRVSGERIE